LAKQKRKVSGASKPTTTSSTAGIEESPGKERLVRSSPPAKKGRPQREELSPTQLRGIKALLTQPTIVAAASEIGVTPRTVSRWFKEPAFAKEYRDQITALQMELWNQMLAVRSEAWTVFLGLMRSSNERIALRASTWALDRMLSVPAILSQGVFGDDRAPANVPPGLEAFLEKSEMSASGETSDAA
jgi:hypothetical protein